MLTNSYVVANAALLLSASFKGSAYHLTNYNGFNFRNDSHYTHALSNSLLLPICDNHETMDCFCIGNQLVGKLGYKGSCTANLHHKCLFPVSHLLSCSSNSGYKIGIHDICVKAIKSYTVSKLLTRTQLLSMSHGKFSYLKHYRILAKILRLPSSLIMI